MQKSRSASFILLAAVTIFVSAFLLFQVQPLISKKILPWFGGSPAVWTTCMLFFQVLLLGGYAYAHLLTRCVSPAWQGRIHAVLLVLAVVTLPIIPSDWWKPADGTWPAGRILLLLAAKVGAPYFLLSTTGPLIQAWFALANPGKSPYRLYALSNVGSLGALLTYPFVFEQFLGVNWQGWLWSGAFVAFAALAGGMGLWIWRIAAGLAEKGFDPKFATGGKEPGSEEQQLPQWYHQIGWLLLAALPSMAFLAITNHLCQDVAPVPLLFIVPLSLYLLTLIICFDREAWYSRVFFGLFGGLVLASLCGLESHARLDEVMVWAQEKIGLGELKPDPEAEAAEENGEAEPKQESLWRMARKRFPLNQFPLTFSGGFNALLKVPAQFGIAKTVTVDDYDDDVYFQAVMYLAALFFGCMLCHGELVKLKPSPQHLTQYYLLISAGGALGGLFVALVSPALFLRAYELPVSIVGCFAVAMLALFFAGQRLKFSRNEMVQWSAAFLCAGCVILIAASQLNEDKDLSNVVTQRRNFYGIIRVQKDTVEEFDGEGKVAVVHEGIALYHGRILHGFQYLTQRTFDGEKYGPREESSRIDTITTYYGPSSGPGLAVRHHPKRLAGKPMNVAVVGLGTGTMAGFARQGDYFCFYDIDPKVKALHDEGIFQFVQRARKRGATVPIELGDARLTMEREAKEKSKQYDIIVLDAFSGDAIPAHLLTLEAVKVYDELLRRDANGNSTGILAVHISNRYLDLAPVVDALATELGFEQVPVDDQGGDDPKDTSSNWILLTRNQEFLDDVVIKAAAAQGTPVAAWHVLQPSSFQSAGGATGTIRSDGSILLSGKVPDKDSYTIRLKTSLADIEGLKIEALTDDSLPGKGPGRGDAKQPDFVLQHVTLTAQESWKTPKSVSFASAAADYSAPAFDAAGAIDSDPHTGWAVGPRFDKPHAATLTFAEPLAGPRSRTLVVRLDQNAGGQKTLGKFRISVLGVDKKPPVRWTDQFSNLLDILK